MKKTRFLSMCLSVCMVLMCMTVLCVTVTASAPPEGMTYSVEIIWVDNNNEAGARPESVAFTGIAGISANSILAELNSNNQWKFTSNDDAYEWSLQNPVEDYDVEKSVNGYQLTTFTLTYSPSPAGNSISLNYQTLEMTVGEQNTLTISYDEPSDPDETAPVFSSSDESVVVINEDGTFTAVGVGQATLRVVETYGTDDEDDDAIAECRVTVREANGGEDEDHGAKAAWAEKPAYVPSGASGTKAAEDEPAPADRDGDDKQDDPQDRDNGNDDRDIGNNDNDNDGDNGKDDDTTVVPDERDTADDGNTGVVDGSASTNENPHTGAVLGGLSVAVLAGAAILVSKKRK